MTAKPETTFPHRNPSSRLTNLTLHLANSATLQRQQQSLINSNIPPIIEIGYSAALAQVYTLPHSTRSYTIRTPALLLSPSLPLSPSVILHTRCTRAALIRPYVSIAWANPTLPLFSLSPRIQLFDWRRVCAAFPYSGECTKSARKVRERDSARLYSVGGRCAHFVIVGCGRDRDALARLAAELLCNTARCRCCCGAYTRRWR